MQELKGTCKVERPARLQGRDAHVVVGPDGHLQVEQAALVQHLDQRGVRVAQAQPARARRLGAHRQLHRRQAAEFHLACTHATLCLSCHASAAPQEAIIP